MIEHFFRWGFIPEPERDPHIFWRGNLREMEEVIQ